MAGAAPPPPVAIADTGDNIGAGTPGDGTALLREIFSQGVDSAFVQLCDPVAAGIAADAGIGTTITLPIGGRSDAIYGPPVEVSGTVRALSDGTYLNRDWGGYSAGTLANMGLSARIDVGGVTIVLNSIRTSPNNILHAKSIGVYPEDYVLSVCKGGVAFRAAYSPPVANTHLACDTPGYSSSDLTRFAFERIPRPIFPLDDI